MPAGLIFYAAHNPLKNKYILSLSNNNNETVNKHAYAEHFIDKLPINKNLSLIVRFKPVIYSIQIQ